MSGNVKEEIIKECKRLEEDVLHSEKNHFVSGSFWRAIYLTTGLIITILAILAGSIAVYFENQGILIAVLTSIVAVISGIITFLNPGERTNNYKSIGVKYSVLRGDIRVFRNIDIAQNDDITKLKKSLASLKARKDNLNEKSLPISKRHRKKAIKGIKEGEAKYTVDSQQRN